MARRDLVVMGGSAGGIEALGAALRGAGPTEARFLVAIHLAPDAHTFLPSILSRQSGLPAMLAVDGALARPGAVTIAPPDHHMVLRAGGTVGTVVGPRENRARPAIDPLFRSAAAVCGPRVVAVVVSGVLDDGTAGARAVRDAGGTIVVQDPGEAVFPGMPRSVIDHVGADHVVPSAGIGPLLRALTREEVTEAMEGTRPDADPSELEPQELQRLAHSGTVSHFTCPECSGTLWEVDEQGLLQYRCRVGHAFSLQTLHAAQAEQVETAMWVAMRALEERASLLRRTAEQSERRGSTRPAESLRARAKEVDRRVDTLRDVLEQLGSVALPESSEPIA